jgi:AcrR family transcriptional regulator
MRLEQTTQALELKRRGLTTDDIAAQLGIARRTVTRRLRSGYAAMDTVDADTARRQYEDKIDSWIRRLNLRLDTPGLTLEQERTLVRDLAALERDRARLLGINVPPRVVIEYEAGAQHAPVNGNRPAGVW